MLKKILMVVGAAIMALVVVVPLWVMNMLTPKPMDLEMPVGLIALESEAGQSMLARSGAKADYEALSSNFRAQDYMSYCGVASSVSVLNALGQSVEQDDFFNDETAKVRSRMDVTFGGMSLPALAGLLEAHGAKTERAHGSDLSLEAFRQGIEANLKQAGDYVVVNYDRRVLKQAGGGHISPVAAYDASGDFFLVMDTAEHKYPPTWVPAPLLYEAILGVDSDSGLSRGVVFVGGP